MGKIKLILLSVLLIAILAVVIPFFISMYSFYQGVIEDLRNGYNRCDSIVREWYFTGTVDQCYSGHMYIRLDSSTNVSMPYIRSYTPPFTLIESDTMILKLRRSGYPSLCAPIGAHVVKNKGNDSIVIGTQTIDLLP